MLEFGIKAPSEAVFWQSWVDAGICTEAGVFHPDYQEIQITAGSWSGVIVKTPAVYDAEGNEITPAETVPGWHCNARVYGALEAEMTYGLEPYDAEGNLKSVFDRTWAINIFQLTWHEADPETGYPAGYSNSSGVMYADMRDFSSPSNVWQ